MTQPHNNSASKSPTPASAGGDDRDKPKKKHKILKWLVILIVSLVVLVGILLLYVQTNHAMQHIILPVASNQMGADITVTRGNLKLPGKVNLDNLSVLDNQGEPILSVKQIQLDIDTGSLLSDSHPVINRVFIDQPSIKIRVLKNRSTNLEHILPGAESTEPNTSVSGPKAVNTLPEMNIQEMLVNKLQLEFQDDQGLYLSIDELNLSLENLVPGKACPVKLDLKGRFSRPESGIKQDVELDARLGLEIEENLQVLSWSVQSGINMSGSIPGIEKLRDISTEITISGKFDLAGPVTAVFNLSTMADGLDAGTVSGEIEWGPTPKNCKGHFRIHGVSHAFLNPWMELVSPIQLTEGGLEIDAEISGHPTGIEYSLKGKAYGWRFVMPRETQPSRPITLQASHDGRFNPESGILNLSNLETSLKQTETELLTIKLSEPLELPVSSISSDPANSAEALEDKSASLEVQLKNIDADMLKPWLVLFRVPGQFIPSTGSLKGEVWLEVKKAGRRIEGRGSLTGRDIRLDLLNRAPLTIQQKFNALVTDHTSVVLRQMDLKISTTQQQYLDIHSTGNIDLVAMACDTNLELELHDPIGMISQFGMVDLHAPPLSGLKLQSPFKISEKVTIDLNTMDLSAKGTGLLGSVKLELGSRSKTIRLDSRHEISFNPAGPRITIEDFSLNLKTTENQSIGEIDLSGSWPLLPLDSLSGESGEINCSLEDFNATPWLQMANIIQHSGVPDIRVGHEQSLEITEQGMLRHQGELKINIPEITSNRADELSSEEIKIVVEHQVDIIRSKIMDFVIRLNSSSKGSNITGVNLKGSAGFWVNTAVSLTGSVDYLLVDPSLVLADKWVGGQARRRSARRWSGRRRQINRWHCLNTQTSPA
jgi:hypothetical protein